MDIQRLRTLTTGRLHTKLAHVYLDLQFLTGVESVFTHQIPVFLDAINPWLKEKIIDPKFWDGKHDRGHKGEIAIKPMNANEQDLFNKRLTAIIHSN
tara:strand:+ start:361 stop:651 length:291 start_codon:yes stop_codon:yes gene_type:complete